MQAQSVLLRRPFDGGYSYAESFDGLHFVKPALGLVTNVTIWSRHAPLKASGGALTNLMPPSLADGTTRWV